MTAGSGQQHHTTTTTTTNNNNMDNNIDDDDEPLPPLPSSSSGGNTPTGDRPVASNPRSTSNPRTPSPLLARVLASSSRERNTTQSPSPIHTYQSLLNRPRSNPRTRTPRRYESPVSPMWNRSNVHEGSDDEDHEEDGRDGRVVGRGVGSGRVTVRIGAGRAVGTTGAATGRLLHASAPDSSSQYPTEQPAPQRSTKQGPSKRKVRRWNNDKFVGIVAELAKSSPRGPQIADAFLRGEADVGMYLMANSPLNYRSSFARLTSDKDGTLADVKDRFIKGEVATAADQKPDGNKTSLSSSEQNKRQNRIFFDGSLMFAQIQPRLRNVVMRAVNRTSSTFSIGVLDAFETFIVKSSQGDDDWVVVTADANETKGTTLSSSSEEKEEKRSSSSVLDSILLRPPIVVTRKQRNVVDDNDSGKKKKKKKKTVVRFHFDPDSSGGAFHRLLLHAVCQFHGLDAASSTKEVSKNDDDDYDIGRARILNVTGTCLGSQFRLVDFAKRAAANAGTAGGGGVGVGVDCEVQQQRQSSSANATEATTTTTTTEVPTSVMERMSVLKVA